MLLPHWLVNGEAISNQVQAWKVATQKQTTPSFYFFDKEYDALDWTTEPKESWVDLCYQRCMLLRQRYKKLSLFYSAGRDSHHILRCFAHFKIPLDQLLLMNWTANSVRQQELRDFIYPQVKKYLKHFPHTKIKLIEIGSKDYDLFYQDDWSEKPDSSFITWFQPSHYRFYVEQNLKADEPNHGVILGVDKPRIRLCNQKFYSTVLDKTVEPFLLQHPNIEYFYYAPDMPKLHLKQCWMLVRHIERNFNQQAVYAPEQIDPLVNSHLGEPVKDFAVNPISSNTQVSKINDEFLIDYCGNSQSPYYDDLCIGSGRGAAWNLALPIQNGQNKYTLGGKEPVFQNIIKHGLDHDWISAHRFVEHMNYLQSRYSTIFNKQDAYLGTIGVYSKFYYMKDLAV